MFIYFVRIELIQQFTSICSKESLPPATKLRQGNVFTPVCHSVHGGVSAYGLGGGGSHPQADTPPGQTPHLGRHPTWADNPQCMLGYTPSCPVHADIHTSMPSACWDTPPCPVHAGIHTLLLWDTVNK